MSRNLIRTHPFLALAACGVLCAGTAALGPAPVTAEAAEVIDCVQSSGGLDLTVVTEKDREAACATGVKVGDAYRAKGFAEGPVSVNVDGAEWSCRLIRGGPDDFPDCTNGMEQVHLSS
ncbi:hypothetical protein [Nonomuraea rubra]|uniref:hypothetical protein n=1 Tax=Nonomuraea rubra TaxID=46180 RepID=UPI0034013CB9